MNDIGAVILAAGNSSRLGQPKQLLRWEGQTLLQRSIHAARDAGCSPIAVVLGAHAAEVIPGLSMEGLLMVENPHWQKGIGTSIRAGVRRLLETNPQMSRIILMVCDQPFVNSQLIRDLMRLQRESSRCMAACRYAGSLGVPALFDQTHFHDLLALDEKSGAKSLLLRHPSQVAELAFEKGGIDIDTPADYENLIHHP